jgi:hypothetical protein
MWLDMYEDQFTLQQEEIDDVCWMDLEDCIRGVKTCSFESGSAFRRILGDNTYDSRKVLYLVIQVELIVLYMYNGSIVS